MNRVMVLLMFAAAFAFAACGGGANNTGGSTNGGQSNEAGHSHGGGHTHEGEEHDLGHRTEGEWHYGAKQIGDPEGGGELVFEVHLQKSGEDVKDATINTWVGDDSGKEFTPRGPGSWVEEEGVYDCHVPMPNDIPETMKFWIEIKHGGKVVKQDSFDVAME